MSLVLDASAVIALLRDEPGADVVRELLEAVDAESVAAGLISAVNLTEVIERLGDDLPELIGGDRAIIATVPYDEIHARAAAAMLQPTRTPGLALADRACLALARVMSLPAVTADRLWSGVDVGVDVVQIR